MKFYKTMKYSSFVNKNQTIILLAFFLALPIISQAQDKGTRKGKEATSPRARVAPDIDRRAKHLYDKAIELMEYKSLLEKSLVIRHLMNVVSLLRLTKLMEKFLVCLVLLAQPEWHMKELFQLLISLLNC